MSKYMYNQIVNYIPEDWSISPNTHVNQMEFVISQNSEEYEEIEIELQNMIRSGFEWLQKIKRIQNVYYYGMFLLQEQLMVAASSPTKNFYRVRRFIKIDAQYKVEAYRSNLDPRRCGILETYVTFYKRIPYVTSDEVIFVVQVITSKPAANTIMPDNSLQYYIEYMVEF